MQVRVFLSPSHGFVHALAKACLTTCKKPSSGSSKACPQTVPNPFAWRTLGDRSIKPSGLAPNRKIGLSFSPELIFWIHCLTSLYRCLSAVLQKGKLWHSGILRRAVKFLYQLLLARVAVVPACSHEYLLPGRTRPMLLFCQASVILAHALGCQFLTAAWTCCSTLGGCLGK